MIIMRSSIYMLHIYAASSYIILKGVNLLQVKMKSTDKKTNYTLDDLNIELGM